MNRKTLFIPTLVLFSVPIIVSAVGLVPCTGAPGDECQACSFITLLDNIFDWLVAVLFVILSLMIVYSGIRLVTSVGDTEVKLKARKMISNAIVGFVIVLLSWLLLDYIMKALINPDSVVFGTWNAIQCEVQPTSL